MGSLAVVWRRGVQAACGLAVVLASTSSVAAPSDAQADRWVHEFVERCGSLSECCDRAEEEGDALACWSRRGCDDAGPLVETCRREYRAARRRVGHAIDRALERGIEPATKRDGMGEAEWGWLVHLLDLAQDIDPARLALIARSSAGGRGFNLGSEFFRDQVAPDRPERNGWLLELIARPPATAEDLTAQRALYNEGLQKRGLPSELLPTAVERFPGLFHRNVRHEHPEIVASLGDRLDACSPVEAREVAGLLAAQLDDSASLQAALARVNDAHRRARVLAEAAAARPEHAAAFLRALGKDEGRTLLDEIAHPISIVLTALDPADDAVAAGIRQVLRLRDAVRVSIEAGHGATKSAWIDWLLGELKTGRVPRAEGYDLGRPATAFSLMLDLGVDITAHFRDLDTTDDRQRGQLIGRWCAQGKTGLYGMPFANPNVVVGYGRDSLASLLSCARKNDADAAWRGWATATAGVASPETIAGLGFEDLFVLAADCDPPQRARLVEVLAARGPWGKLLAELLPLASFNGPDDDSARIAAFGRALRALEPIARLPGAPESARDEVEKAFEGAALALRSRLAPGGVEPPRCPPPGEDFDDIVSRDLRQAAASLTTPIARTQWLDAVVRAVLGGPSDCLAPTL
jgi:hypothetical protein